MKNFSVLDAIKETLNIDLSKEYKDGYEINFLPNYCGWHIVDVEVIDYEIGERQILECYDMLTHSFPWFCCDEFLN